MAGMMTDSSRSAASNGHAVSESQTELGELPAVGLDTDELAEWYESLDDVFHRYGPEEVRALLLELQQRASAKGVTGTASLTTPYINTIPVDAEPSYPGDRKIERKIRSIVRWNAMAMVVQAARSGTSVGGHISTFASSACLVETGFNHFFHAPSKSHTGDFVYFQGHASPGVYSRAFVEGRLDESHLKNFRRELPRGQGLSSYPHPWLMPDFWQFPTVSMGLGPLCSLYQARFLRYLQHRGLLDTSQSRVWCFIGDGEVDEPETLGAITLGAREHLDNVTWVINCNLQRLDGPVRGNGKIIQELEGLFRGAGWNVLKVIWGADWDPILANDESGQLKKRMLEIVDGQFQKYVVESGSYIRQDFFGKNPELLKLVEHLSDDQIKDLRRGGHDAQKVYTAYHAAVNHKGVPTVILAHTIKGYGLGESAEGKNTTHQQKKLEEDDLLKFRTRFELPLSDEEAKAAKFYKPDPSSPEVKYMLERRKELGGFLPVRKPTSERLTIPSFDQFQTALKGSVGKEWSTTMVLGRIMGWLCTDKNVGKRIVPIIPDEAQTFGMHTLFAQVGIYSSKGQQYTPVDAGQMVWYREETNGQILMEGINEAGAMSSFVAAGTAYANLGLNMIPFYVYYSMFGFQRVGDLIWLAGDSRAKGFLCGGTSGRISLNGEGLQHQDGHSQLIASSVPNLLAYDPAFGYEVAAIVQDGMRRMYAEDENVFYYLSVYNDGSFPMPAIPAGVTQEMICAGLYPLEPGVTAKKRTHRPQLLGSGPIMQYVLKAKQILSEKYGVEADVWSVTSYNELKRNAQAVARWNALHPDKKPKQSHIDQVTAGVTGPFISASENVQLVAEQIRQYLPGRYTVLGCDGFGRSEAREVLRRHFEVDAECIVFAALSALAKDGHFDAKRLPKVLQELGIDPEKVDPATA